MKNKLIATWLALSFLLIGCNGGGDDDDVAPAPDDVNLLPLNSSNAIPAAGEVLGGFASSLGIGPIALAFNPVHPILLSLVFPTSGDSVTVSATVGETGVLTWPAPLRLFDDSTQPLRRIPVQTDTVSVAVVIEQTIPCAGGGSILVSGNIESASRITVGDNLTSQYLDCVISGLDQPINGRISSTITAVGGDGTLQTIPFSFAIASVFDGFSLPIAAATTPLPVLTIDGDSTWQFATDDGVIFRDVASGQRISLTVTGALDPTENGSGVLTDFTSVLTSDAANPDLIAYSADGGGGVESSVISGAVVFEIVQNLTGFIGVGAPGFPSQGQVVIRGAENSTVTITAVSETQVQIDVDQNGDGVSDATWLLNWSELLPEGFLEGILS